MDHLGHREAETRYKTRADPGWSVLLVVTNDPDGPDGVFSNWSLSELQQADYAGRGAVMPDYVLGYLGSGGAAPELLATARQRMTQYADTVVRTIVVSEHAHRSPRGP